MADEINLNLNIKGGTKATRTIGQLEQELAKAREEIKGIERFLDSMDIPYSKAITDDPLGLFK